MNKQLVIIGVIALLILGGGILYISRPGEASQTQSAAQKDGQTSNTEATSQAEITQNEVAEESSNPSTPALAVESDQEKTFTLEGSDFKFSLTEMRVKKGDTVKVTLVNRGGVHDFVIDEFNAKTPQITAGKTTEVEFVADKTGTFEYYCSVGQHRKLGMKGNLIVE